MTKRRARRRRQLLVALAHEFDREIRMLLVGVLSVIAIALFISYASTPVERNFEVSSYQKYRICYNTVNVRTEPDTNSEINRVLTLGEYVELSGKSIFYRACDVNDCWYELADGTWIISDAVMDSDEFHFRFGS